MGIGGFIISGIMGVGNVFGNLHMLGHWDKTIAC